MDLDKRISTSYVTKQLTDITIRDSPSKHKDKHGFIISQCKHTEL